MSLTFKFPSGQQVTGMLTTVRTITAMTKLHSPAVLLQMVREIEISYCGEVLKKNQDIQTKTTDPVEALIDHVAGFDFNVRRDVSLAPAAKMDIDMLKKVAEKVYPNFIVIPMSNGFRFVREQATSPIVIEFAETEETGMFGIYASEKTTLSALRLIFPDNLVGVPSLFELYELKQIEMPFAENLHAPNTGKYYVVPNKEMYEVLFDDWTHAVKPSSFPVIISTERACPFFTKEALTEVCAILKGIEYGR